MKASIIDSTATRLIESEGLKGPRLQVIPNCPSALIAIQECPNNQTPSYNPFKWVPLKIETPEGQKIVLVNVASLCKRLLIDFVDLFITVLFNRLEKLLQNKKERIEKRDAVLSSVENDMEKAERLVEIAEDMPRRYEKKCCAVRLLGVDAIYANGKVYVIGKERLGKGAVKEVVKVVEINSNQHLAGLQTHFKTTFVDDYEREDDEALRSTIEREVNILRKLNKEGYTHSPHTHLIAPTTLQTIFIQDLYPEDLEKSIQQGRLTKEEKKRVTGDLLAALCDLHAKEIVHGDLKPTNVLIAKNKNGTIESAKITDFGCAKETSDPTKQEVGSKAYWSPETMNNETYQEPGRDVWALGMILYELYRDNLDPAFRGPIDAILNIKSDFTFMRMIRNLSKKNELTTKPQNPHSIEYLIWQMLRADPRDRITAEDAFTYFLDRLEYL